MFCAHQSLRLNRAYFCNCLDIDTLSEGLSTNFYPHEVYVLFSCVCTTTKVPSWGVVFSAQLLLFRGRIHFLKKFEEAFLVCLCFLSFMLQCMLVHFLSLYQMSQVTKQHREVLFGLTVLQVSVQSVDTFTFRCGKQHVVLRMCAIAKELSSRLGGSGLRKGPSSPNTFLEHPQNYQKTFHQAPPLQFLQPPIRAFLEIKHPTHGQQGTNYAKLQQLQKSLIGNRLIEMRHSMNKNSLCFNKRLSL